MDDAIQKTFDEKSKHDTQYPTGVRLVITLLSLSLGAFLMALDSTIISVATPQISTEFHALDDVGWYSAAYGMTLCAFTPILSTFYKQFNPKLVFLTVIVIFEVGSVVCAAAPSSPAFIAGRAVAGLGAAGLLQGAFGMLTYICDLKTRPLFMGLVVSLFGLMSAMGPLIGGAFTKDVTWRWCFWINLPIGGVVFFLVVVFMKLFGVDPEPRRLPLKEKLRRFDVIGVIILLGSVICLFLALQIGGSQVPWSNSKPIGLFIGFGLLVIVFGARQWQARENAMIPLRFFRDRTVVFGSLYLFAQVLCAVGAGLLTTIRVGTTTAQWATYMALTGAGLGLGVNVPHIAVQAVFENDNDIFIANGIASFFGQLGGSLGVPIANAILISSLNSEVPRYAPSVSPETVISAGALNVTSLTDSPNVLHGLRAAWSIAVAHVNILLTSIICISVPTALGMRWLNLKKISEARDAEKKGKQGTGEKGHEASEVEDQVKEN